MPFRIQIEEGDSIREHIVYNKEEVDGLSRTIIDRQFSRLMGGDIGRVSSTLQDAQDAIDDLNNNQLPNLQDQLDALDGDLTTLESDLTDLNNELDGKFPITTTDISDDAITTPKLIAEAVTASKILANTITANEIAADTITANEIAANTITANEILADTITANEIGADTITANELNISQLSAITASMGALTVDDVLTIGAGGSLKGSNWLIDENTWSHPALGGVVWSLANKAGFGTGDSVSNLSTGTWTTSASAVDGDTIETEQIKQKIQYIAKEGIDEVTVTGFVNRTSSGDGFGHATIKISIDGQTSESSQVGTTSFNEASATVSNLSLTTGDTYVVDVILKASSTANQGMGVSHTTEANLRDDIVISEGVS